MASVNPLSSLKPPIKWKEYEQTLTRLYQSWNLLSPEQQSRALEQVLEMQAAREELPSRFLIPNGAQEKVIRDIGNLEYFIVGACFANGVGKSAIVLACLGAIMWGAPSSAFDYPLYRQYPARWPKLVRIATESALVGQMGPVQVESKLWWPKGRYEWSKGGKQHNSYFETDTGFKGEVMTYEQAVKEYEGKTNAVNCFIEPPPRDILFASFARQRKGGINIIDMTPLTSAAYIKDEIVDKPEIVIDGQSVGKVSFIHADIEENCEDHGINGQLKHRDILQIVSRYDPDELEARAHGKFMHLSGRVYKSFDRNAHVKEFPTLTDDVSHGMAADPAIAKPMALLWYFVDRDGVVYFYDEHPEYQFQGAKDSNLSVSDYVKLIKAKEEGKKIDARILDRHFGIVRRNMGGETLFQEFSNSGLDFTESYATGEEIETGILKVREYLKYDKSKPIDSLNRPRIVIHPRCVNLIAAFERWSWDTKANKPKEEYKDFMDIARYIIMSNPAVYSGGSWPDGQRPHYGIS